MVHKLILKTEEGILLKDGAPVLLTKREYENGRKRFKKRFAGDEIESDLGKMRKK